MTGTSIQKTGDTAVIAAVSPVFWLSLIHI